MTEEPTITLEVPGCTPVTASMSAYKEALSGLRSDNSETAAGDIGEVAGQRLKAFIERIERLEEEKQELAEDIKEIYAEAKSAGFDARTIRKIIRLRTMDTETRREEEVLLTLYKAAIGMEDFTGTPLGKAAGEKQ